MKKYTFYLLFLGVVFINKVCAQNPTPVCFWGNLNLQPTVNTMILEAGLPIPFTLTTLVSAPNAIQFGAVGAGNRDYRVFVSRQDVKWHNNMKVWFRVTSNGSADIVKWGPIPTPVNNTNYNQPVSANWYFDFKGNIPNTDCMTQVEISFIGPVDADTYQTKFIFTVIQL
jgi:hypothetical protein